MFEFNTTLLLAKVAIFKARVRNNRETCGTDFARDIHDTLSERLGELGNGLNLVLDHETKVLGAHRRVTQPDFDIEFVRAFFGFNWFARPMSLLDGIEAPFDDDNLDEGDGFLDYTEVPALELEGLSEIINEIYREVGVRFVVARVAKEGGRKLSSSEGGQHPAFFQEADPDDPAFRPSCFGAATAPGAAQSGRPKQASSLLRAIFSYPGDFESLLSSSDRAMAARRRRGRAVPPIVRRRPSSADRKSAPPLAGSTGR